MSDAGGADGNVFPWQIRPSREVAGGAEGKPEAEPEAEPDLEPELDEAPPTEAMSVAEFDDGPPTEAMALADLDEGPPTEAMTLPAGARPSAAAETVPASAENGTELIGVPGEHEIDDVFGTDKFTEHDAEPLFVTRARETATREPRPKRTSFTRNQKILLWTAGILLAFLALLVLYFLGTRLARVATQDATPTPTPTMSETAAPTPEPTVRPVGPVAPGEYDWTELLGGECLDPYVSPWEESFTVVDCATPHAAQVMGGGDFPEAVGDPFPGADALQAQINVLCTSPTVVDYAAAALYSDIVIAASYPVTEQEWADGYRSFSCFASRSSGEPLAGSIAVVPPG